MSPATGPDEPAVSVVIPTYNRADLLRRTLESLRRQRSTAPAFEVVVADDGSTDDTRDVVHSFGPDLPVRYYHQEDLGFRAAGARNGGARLAIAPVLVFVDTGAVAGPDFVRAHHRAHHTAGAAGAGSVVVGYSYGYHQGEPVPGLATLLAEVPPEEVIARLGDLPELRDMRDAWFPAAGTALDDLLTAWILPWAVNFSVTAESFHAAGGFDEEFRGWGTEDVELGFRLARRGARFAASRAAWVIETPLPRDGRAVLVGRDRNLRRFLRKHPHPAVELYWALSPNGLALSMEREYRDLLDWTREARETDVRGEIETAVRTAVETALAAAGPAGPPRSVAVLGCGDQLPGSWPPGVRVGLADFDSELLGRAVAACPGAVGEHAIGLRTPFPAGSFDLVVVTSRLQGLWPRWGERIRDEARRIGRETRIFPVDTAPVGATAG